MQSDLSKKRKLDSNELFVIIAVEKNLIKNQFFKCTNFVL